MKVSILLLFFPLNLYSQIDYNSRIQKEIDSIRKLRTQESIGKIFRKFNAKSINKVTYSNNNLKNKVTLVNFWFEACTPCIAEFQALNELWEKFKTNYNFQFLTFTFESKIDIERIKKKYSLSFEILPISRDSCYYLNYESGFPTNIIIDKEGRVRYITSGGSTNPQQAKRYIETIITPIIIKLLEKKIKNLHQKNTK